MGRCKWEVYPNHDDFAVRTLGVPGLGALGVTFGRTIAMDSPSGRPPGQFHWASTLWHEMSHVFTLTMTNSRVPRWFTEGIAVHEETAVSKEWGDRLAPEEDRGHQGQDAAAGGGTGPRLHPSQEPGAGGVSYFQAGRICDYITDKFRMGNDSWRCSTITRGRDTPAVIRKELKMAPEEFDRRFSRSWKRTPKTTVDHFSDWKTRIRKVNEMSKAKDWDGVIKEGLAIRDLYPDYVEAGSVYEFLAAGVRGEGR